jgi:hypothetical protein
VLPAFSLIFNVDTPRVNCMTYPQLYKVSQEGKSLNMMTFMRWSWLSLWQALIIFSTDIVAHKENTLFSIVTVSFTSLMICEMLNIIIRTEKRNWKINTSCLMSISVYFLCLYCFGDYFGLKPLNVVQLLEILFIVATAWLPFQILEWIEFCVCPTTVQKLSKMKIKGGDWKPELDSYPN